MCLLVLVCCWWLVWFDSYSVREMLHWCLGVSTSNYHSSSSWNNETSKETNWKADTLITWQFIFQLTEIWIWVHNRGKDAANTKKEQLLTQISTLKFLHQRVSHCRCHENPQNLWENKKNPITNVMNLSIDCLQNVHS